MLVFLRIPFGGAAGAFVRALAGSSSMSGFRVGSVGIVSF